jgi:hypothetical protein
MGFLFDNSNLRTYLIRWAELVIPGLKKQQKSFGVDTWADSRSGHLFVLVKLLLEPLAERRDLVGEEASNSYNRHQPGALEFSD